MTVPSDAASGTAGNWLFKNKEHGKTSAAASLVYLYLRDRLTLCSYLGSGNCNRTSLFPMLGYDSTVGCGRRTYPT